VGEEARLFVEKTETLKGTEKQKPLNAAASITKFGAMLVGDVQ
jgi:hypothetical protein